MSDLVKPGITKAMVEQHLSLLGAYTLAGIVAATDEIGVGWFLRNTEWDDWGESLTGVRGLTAMAMVLRWYGDDRPIDEGDYFERVTATDPIDPIEALRDVVGRAFAFIVENWVDEDEADADWDDEAPAAVGEEAGR